jgi:hypothetical protein
MHTKLASFVAWSTSQGITTPLQLVIEKSYRYMTLPSDDSQLFEEVGSSESVNLVSVPLDACIVADDSQALAERLIHEKSLGEDSKYAPWLEMFPSLNDFQGMPRFWAPERLELVQKSDGGQLADRMKFDQLRFDKVDDQWALAVVDSRSNFLPDGTYSISPMLDMFNHDSTVPTSASVEEGRLLLDVSPKAFFVPDEPAQEEEKPDWKKEMFGLFRGPASSGSDAKSSGSDAKSSNCKRKGSEIFISYGDLNNLECLCNYGFVPDNNGCNTETLTVRMMRQPPATIVVDDTGSMDNMFNQLTLSSLRLNLATIDELEELKMYAQGAKISDKNELEVYALIGGELEEAVYEAQNGIKEAEEVNDALAAAYLAGRKATLQKAAERLQRKYPEIYQM